MPGRSSSFRQPTIGVATTELEDFVGDARNQRDQDDAGGEANLKVGATEQREDYHRQQHHDQHEAVPQCGCSSGCRRTRSTDSSSPASQA